MKLADEIEAEWMAEVEQLEDEIERLRAVLLYAEEALRACNVVYRGVPAADAVRASQCFQDAAREACKPSRA